MVCHNLFFLEKYGKLFPNYPCYPSSGVLDLDWLVVLGLTAL